MLKAFSGRAEMSATPRERGKEKGERREGEEKMVLTFSSGDP